MEFIFPWGAFLKKTGGTITGNLIINGTLQADLDVLFQQDLTVSQNVQIDGTTLMNNQLVIVRDAIAPGGAHILMRPATAGGTLVGWCTEDLALNFSSCWVTLTTSSTTEMGGSPSYPLSLPSVIVEPDPPVKIPLLNATIGMRRAMLTHGVMFG